MVNIINLTTAIFQIDQNLQNRQDILFAQNPDRIFNIHVQSAVHLHPANSREIVFFRIKEQVSEQLMGRFQCWRLTRAHHPVDINKRFFTTVIAVSRQRVAQVRANIYIVDTKHGKFADIVVTHHVQHVFGDLITGLSLNHTCIHIHQV